MAHKAQRRMHWACGFIALLALPVLARIAAADEDRYAAEWRWVRFTHAEGLPEDRVRAVEETSDGMVWAATASGLARYDGWTWRLVEGKHDLGRASIRSMAVGPQGRLWLTSAGGLFRGGADGFERVAVPPHLTDCVEVRRAGARMALLGSTERGRTLLVLPADNATTATSATRDLDDRPKPARLIGTRTQQAWLSFGNALLTWDGRAWTPWFPDEDQSLTFGCVAANARGAGLAAVLQPLEMRGVWEWGPGEPPRRNSAEGHGWVVAADVAPDGHALAVYDTGDVRERDADGVWREVRGAPDDLAEAEWIAFRDNGDLWVGTERGLHLCRSSGSPWSHWRHGYRQSERDSVNEILIGRDGTLWIASGQGVEALRPDGTPVEMAFSERVLHVTGLAEDRRGHIWAVSGGAYQGARVWDGASWRHETEDASGQPLGLIHKARTDRSGRVWLLGVARDLDPGSRETGVVHVVEDGRPEPWQPGSALGGRRFYDFAEAADGKLWFATSTGVARHADSTWREWGPDQGLVEAPCFALEPAPDGGAWVAQKWGGVFRIDADGAVAYQTRHDRFVDSHAWDLATDESGRIWATTDAGLACFHDGHWNAIGPESGLEASRLWPATVADGKLYLGSRGRGVWQLDLRSVEGPSTRVRLQTPAYTGSEVIAHWTVRSHWGHPAPEIVETRVRLDDGVWGDWSTRRTASFDDPGGGSHRVEVQAKGPFGNLSPIAARTLDVPLALGRNPRFVVPMSLLAVALLGVSLDLWRRRRAALRLAAREAHLSELIEQASDAIVVMDPDTSVRMVNAEGVALFERAAARLRGRRLDEFLDRPLDIDGLSGAAEGADESDGRAQVERVVTKPDESTVDVEISFRALPDGRIQAIVRDLSERHRLERERLDLERRLAEKQRLESLGLLAGGVAHDFNNLLTAILGNVDLALRQIEPGSDVAGSLELVKKSAGNAAGMTQQLLTFAGRDALVLEDFDVNAAIRETVALLRPTLPEALTVNLVLDRGLPLVHGDGTRLRQVLLNLIVNASDAIGDAPGRLTVTTGTSARPRASDRSGLAVQVKVLDDGCGMNETTLARIFDPFFTTKTTGRGLGLAAVRGILRRHGGSIRVASRVGTGTSFLLTVPASGPRLDVDPVGDDLARRPSGSTLIVDDEPQVLGVTAALVESLGFEPILASTGEDAVRIALDHGGAISNAVIDLRLVGMEGHQVVDELRRHFPHMPVVLVSGWDDEIRRAQRVERDGVTFLSKPFTRDQLRDMLDDATKS